MNVAFPVTFRFDVKFPLYFCLCHTKHLTTFKLKLLQKVIIKNVLLFFSDSFFYPFLSSPFLKIQPTFFII